MNLIHRASLCGLLFFSIFVVGCKSVGSQSTAGVYGADGKNDTLDQDIRAYQIDAVLCGFQALVAGIPGHNKILERVRCAAHLGLDATQAIRAGKTCLNRDMKSVDRFLACMKTGAEYFGGSKEAMACFLPTEHTVKHVLENLSTLGAVIGCSLTVVKGGKLLYKATKAANEARAEARQKAEVVRRMISSWRASRIYNMAYFRGCHFMTKLPTMPSEQECFSHCQGISNGRSDLSTVAMNQSQIGYHRSICRSGCRATEALPSSWVSTMFGYGEYQTRNGCQDFVEKALLPENASRIAFRPMEFPGIHDGTPEERYFKYLAGRARILAVIDILEDNWGDLPKTPRGTVRVTDIVNLANKPVNSLENEKAANLRLVGSTLGPEYANVYHEGKNVPLFANLLESSSTDRLDGEVEFRDLSSFRDEVETYYNFCDGNRRECGAFADWAANGL